MSGVDRKALRDAARLALRGAPGLDGYTEISAWVQKVDARSLPAWAVVTPTERRDRQTNNEAREDLMLAVIIKRTGGDDLEDLMDDDADAVAGVVVGALRDDLHQCELAQTEMRLDGDGAERVASLTLSFNVTYWVDDPL
jgi:hypothetical protein